MLFKRQPCVLHVFIFMRINDDDDDNNDDDDDGDDDDDNDDDDDDKVENIDHRKDSACPSISPQPYQLLVWPMWGYLSGSLSRLDDFEMKGLRKILRVSQRKQMSGFLTKLGQRGNC